VVGIAIKNTLFFKVRVTTVVVYDVDDKYKKIGMKVAK